MVKESTIQYIQKMVGGFAGTILGVNDDVKNEEMRRKLRKTILDGAGLLRRRIRTVLQDSESYEV